MNFVVRAWRYICRNITKTILLAVTFFVIGNLVVLGLGISQAAENAKILTRRQMRAAVSYEVDYNAYYEYVSSLTDQDEIDAAYKNSPQLDLDTAEKIAKDSRIKAYNFMQTGIAYAIGFDHIPLGNEDTKGTSTMLDENGNEVEYQDPNIQILANNSPNMIELTDGTFTVTDGDMFTQNDLDQAKNVCLITKDLADANNLHVGDSISFSLLDSTTKKGIVDTGVPEDSLNATVDIIGIFTTTREVDQTSDEYKWMSPWQSPKNVILMPMTAFAQISYDVGKLSMDYYRQQYPDQFTDTDTEDYSLKTVSQPSSIIFLLDDPLSVDQFVKDYTPMLGEYTMLNANNEAFQKMARPLDTLSFFANIIVAIVMVNAVIIISLVTALTLKTREYEIGVLLSLGVSKFKIVVQLFLELMIIALIGFSLAVASGSMIAGKVGDAVLKFQTDTDAQYTSGDDTQDYNYSSGSDYFTTVTQEDLFSKYHVSVSPLLILEIYLLGTGVVFVSIVIPAFMIMRLNPKQILMEQN